MQMSFDVGQQERHRVVFSFDKFWGGLAITVDGSKVVNKVELFGVKLVKTWEFSVGVNERHVVRIEKHRKVMFSGFRPQPVLAYVDGQLVAQGVA